MREPSPPRVTRTVPAWIRTARPPVPDELARWLAEAPDGRDVEGLVRAALDALERAAASPDRGPAETDAPVADGGGVDAAEADPSGRIDRERAFHLLAADGLLTYACEASLLGERPEPLLRELAGRVARRGSGPPPDRG